MESGPPRITFDTNACNLIHDPNKWPNVVTSADAQKVKAAISNGRIKAFVSEASMFVECLSFPDKLNYLAAAGTHDPRPALDPRTQAIFADLSAIGAKLLHAPQIGAEKFSDLIPWADDEVYNQKDRQHRFSSFCQTQPLHDPLRAYGASLLVKQPPLPPRISIATGPNSFSVPTPQKWAIGLKREWDSGTPDGGKGPFRKKVGGMIGEWCDGLIVGSHFAYGNDIFCTTDEGKKAGPRSLLHRANWPNLAGQGILIMTPGELVQYVPTIRCTF